MIDVQRNPLVLMLSEPLRWLPSDFVVEVDIVRLHAQLHNALGIDDAAHALQTKLMELRGKRRAEVVTFLEQQQQARISAGVAS